MYPDRLLQRARQNKARASTGLEAVELAEPPAAAGSRSHEQYAREQAPASDGEIVLTEVEKEVSKMPLSLERLEPETDPIEMEALRQENAALNKRVAMLEKQLGDSTSKARFWAQQQRDYESLLDEKSEVIRELHLKLQEQSARPVAPAPSTPREEEILELHEQLEEEKEQLKRDEDALQQQMRDMELQMSRERADMARQKVELQRLHDELKMELEMASRESSLRERLAPLQRKHSDLIHRRGMQPAPAQAPAASGKSGIVPTPAQKPAQSGIFRRLFGQQE